MHKYGWIKDKEDHRDLFRMPRRVELPPSVDLRPLMPPVYDQGQIGSCTGNATAAAVQMLRNREGLFDFTPSRLFIYYHAREMEGTVSEDAGAMIRDCIKVMANIGACSEYEWPYDTSQWPIEPPSHCDWNAHKDMALRYERVYQTETDIKACLADGYPVILGIILYDSFESSEVARTGIVHLPQEGESVVGGHAVLCVGYQEDGRWIMRNSWGDSWGIEGYFTLPREYLLRGDLAQDMWAIQLVGQ